MKTASLKFKKYAESLSIMGNTENILLRTILGAFGILALWYIFLLGNIVFNIIERKTVEAQTRILSSEVSNLELNYLALSNGIDLDLSHKLGFREVKAQFATRKSLSSLGNLSLVQNDL
jgi:hypothetical protein